ncbi:MAG: phage portal protein [Actinomycetota bacterium]
MAEPTTEEEALALLVRLSDRLEARRFHLETLDRYYDGEHDLLFATERFRKAFGGLFREFADNWCELVVDAVEERLSVTGFRVGDATEADAEAWRIWQANGLDAESQVGTTNALVHGAGYVMVGPDDDDERTPLITIEDAHEVIVDHDPARRRRRRAALKRYRDEEEGREYATLYTPSWIWRFQAPLGDTHPRRGGGSHAAWGDNQVQTMSRSQEVTWERREIEGREWPEVNAYDEVMIVPLYNRPRGRRGKTDTWGVSEIGRMIPIQNAVNKLFLDMLVAGEFQGFPQRWATGLLDDEEDKKSGAEGGPTPFEQRVERFVAGASTMFTTEDTDTKFGQFPSADLGNFVQAIEMAVQHIASQTRTPPHYFYLRGNMPSGESIKSAETGLVAKARRKMRHFGEGWEEVMRLAGKVAGINELAEATSMETMWADPESRSEGQLVDSLVKKKDIGVPLRQLWEDAGYSPEQIARFEALRVQEGLLGGNSEQADSLARTLQQIYLAVPNVISTEEAREVAIEAGADIDPEPPPGVGPAPRPGV